MKPDGGGAYSRYDKLVLKYRAFYRGWVDRVAETGGARPHRRE
ncbi:putative phenylpropionate dioxygenase, large terminal subunit [Burkholderia cepacia]|nr:putative phenylpropionate dioxygenase, large terminal subunit [Burkholderia cepacia]